MSPTTSPLARPGTSARALRRIDPWRPAFLAALATLLAAGAAHPQPSLDPDDLAAAGPRMHQKRQARPIQLGTSGGNVNDLSLPFCCSGTLGALLEKNGRFFVLSNNHVLARINQAAPGEPINQPGMIDNHCAAPEADFVATLSDYQKLRITGRNKVDAAIAEVIEGTVDPEGTIVRIGVPGNTWINPAIGMPVMKSGRTTGFRRGEVVVTNFSGFIAVPESCSEETPIFLVKFVKQFVVAGTKKDFSAGGDSGSVIYYDAKECPPAVGLLFAGDGIFTLANRMKHVIKAAKKMAPRGKASLVGCDPEPELAAAASRSEMIAADDPSVRLAERLQRRVEDGVLSLEGVHGMGIGRSSEDPRAVVLKVAVEDDRPSVLARIPERIEGLPVEVMKMPRFVAYRGCSPLAVEDTTPSN